MCAGFLVCSLQDLRRREVSMELSLGMLLGAAVYALLAGYWTLVLLSALLIGSSDLRWKWLRSVLGVLGTISLALLQPGHTALFLSLFVVWSLWEYGTLGGADVKLVMAALFVHGSAVVLVPIALLGGLQGVIALLRRKREIPFVLSIFGGSLLYSVYRIIYV